MSIYESLSNFFAEDEEKGKISKEDTERLTKKAAEPVKKPGKDLGTLKERIDKQEIADQKKIEDSKLSKSFTESITKKAAEPVDLSSSIAALHKVVEKPETEVTEKQTNTAMEAITPTTAAPVPGQNQEVTEDWYDKRYNQLKAEYEANKENLEDRQVLEAFVQAITKFAAAKKGLATGVDMSGVEFKPQNWDSKLSAALDEFKTKTSLLRDRAAERRQAEQFKVGKELERERLETEKEQHEDTLKFKYDKLYSEQGMAQLKQQARQQAELAAQKIANVKDTQKSEDLLRNEWEKSDTTKNTKGLARAYGDIDALIGIPYEDQTGAGHIAALTKFIKTLDPNSTVSGKEFEAAEGASGQVVKWVNIANKFGEGKMPEKLMMELREEAAKLYKNQLEQQAEYDKHLMRTIEDRGIDNKKIIRKFGLNKKMKRNPKTGELYIRIGSPSSTKYEPYSPPKKKKDKKKEESEPKKDVPNFGSPF